MKNLIFALFAFSLMTSACDETELPSEPANDMQPFMIATGEPALVIAHRGGKRLRPENTLEAFDHAVAIGVDVLEMDVAITADSVLVTIHDLDIDRTCEAGGKVIDYTFAELQQFNFGYEFEDSSGAYPYRGNPVRIPSIEQVIERYQYELLMIEIKDQGADGMLAADILHQHIVQFDVAANTIVFAFADDVMAYYKTINSADAYTGATLGEGFGFVQDVQSGQDSSKSYLPDVFAFPTGFGNVDLTDPMFAEAAHRHNKGMHYWTINDRDQMRELIQNGADGIITDRPDVMQSVLIELGF